MSAIVRRPQGRIAIPTARHDHYCPCGDCYVGRMIAAGETRAIGGAS